MNTFKCKDCGEENEYDIDDEIADEVSEAEFVMRLEMQNEYDEKLSEKMYHINKIIEWIRSCDVVPPPEIRDDIYTLTGIIV